MRAALASVLAVLATVLAGPAPARAAAAAPPPVTAPGVVVWDPHDGRVLFGKEEGVGRPMASTTKIMTTLLAVESGVLGETVTVSSRAASFGEASLGLRTGQQVPAASLLAGLMIRSGNDAAVAVAEHVAGSEDAFVEKMNARAQELGLEDTAFVNASGLTNDPTHRASPRDLAQLAEVAMRRPEFQVWAGAPILEVPPFGRLVNRNLLLTSYEGATGVKTGNTRLAGWCLVASAERDGRRLISVVLGSESADTYFAESAALLDYGFTAFRRAQPLLEGAVATTYRWADAAVELRAAGDLGLTMAVDATATWRTVLPPDLPRPVAAGSPAGVAQLIVDGAVAAEVPLALAADVASAPPRPPAEEIGGAIQEAARAFVRLQALDRAA